MKPFNHASLFSGIGGFELAADVMGWNNVLHCEINPFGRKILNYYWPKSISYEDITKTNFTVHRETIDIITGGFPCQPYSVAGNRKGKADSRHLWPEMLRAIREIQPTWIIGENVPGLINWNAGLVFDEVQTDLEANGYEVIPFILPACAVNAPHKRERVWFIAYCNLPGRGQSNEKMAGRSSKQFNRFCIQKFNSNPTGNRLYQGESTNNRPEQNKPPHRFTPVFTENVTNTGNQGLQRIENIGSIAENEPEPFNKKFSRSFCSFNKEHTVEPPVCNGDNGFSARLDGITFSKWRIESIKAAGNAIVPQVALQIFKAIEEFNNQINPVS